MAQLASFSTVIFLINLENFGQTMSSKGKGTESSGSSANKRKGQAGRMPKIRQPMKRKISLPMRRSHTPSNMAKAEGFSCAMDHVESKPNEGRTWGTREVAPEEVEGDDGWIPGPANRAATEEYCGRAFGIVDKELHYESAPLDFLMTQLIEENKEMIMELTADKMIHDFAAKSAAGKKCGRVDRAMKPSDLTAKGGPRYFNAWRCCKILIGQRTKGYPAKYLWNDRNSGLCNCIPYQVYQCMNKYISFAPLYSFDGTKEEDGEGGGGDDNQSDDEEDNEDGDNEDDDQGQLGLVGRFLERLCNQVFSEGSLRKRQPACAVVPEIPEAKVPRCRASDQQHHTDLIIDFKLQYEHAKANAISGRRREPTSAKKRRCAVCVAAGDSKKYNTVWCKTWCQRCQKWFHIDCAKRACNPKRRLGADAAIGAS
jgi:hypothetical protein